MFLIQVHDRRVFNTNIHRCLQTNCLFWPLLSCSFKNCAYCSVTSLLLILSLYSWQWLPASILQISHPSFYFLIHLALLFTSSFVLHHSNPFTFLSQHPKLFPHFQYLHPAFILSIFMLSMFGSLLDLSLCLPGCHNPSLLPHVAHNSCLAFYTASSSPQQRSCSQTSFFWQYLILLPPPIRFLSSLFVSLSSRCCLIFLFFSAFLP